MTVVYGYSQNQLQPLHALQLLWLCGVQVLIWGLLQLQFAEKSGVVRLNGVVCCALYLCSDLSTACECMPERMVDWPGLHGVWPRRPHT